MLIGGGVLALAGIGGFMMMGGKPAAEEKPAAAAVKDAAGDWGKKRRPDEDAVDTVDWGEPLGDITEAEVLAGLKTLDSRMAKVEDTFGKIVLVANRMQRLEERLLGTVDDEAAAVADPAVAALAGRVAAAEAALEQKAGGDVELDDPQILAALELLAAKLAKLEAQSAGK